MYNFVNLHSNFINVKVYVSMILIYIVIHSVLTFALNDRCCTMASIFFYLHEDILTTEQIAIVYIWRHESFIGGTNKLNKKIE